MSGVRDRLNSPELSEGTRGRTETARKRRSGSHGSRGESTSDRLAPTVWVGAGAMGTVTLVEKVQPVQAAENEGYRLIDVRCDGECCVLFRRKAVLQVGGGEGSELVSSRPVSERRFLEYDRFGDVARRATESAYQEEGLASLERE